MMSTGYISMRFPLGLLVVDWGFFEVPFRGWPCTRGVPLATGISRYHAWLSGPINIMTYADVANPRQVGCAQKSLMPQSSTTRRTWICNHRMNGNSGNNRPFAGISACRHDPASKTLVRTGFSSPVDFIKPLRFSFVVLPSYSESVVDFRRKVLLERPYLQGLVQIGRVEVISK